MVLDPSGIIGRYLSFGHPVYPGGVNWLGIGHVFSSNCRLAAESAFIAEDISTVMASNDDVVAALDLPVWGRKNRIKVLNSRDLNIWF